MSHRSVLLQETIDGLHLKLGMTVVDGTYGGGGHALAIAERIGASGTLVAIDADADAFVRAPLADLSCKSISVVSNFRRVKEILDQEGITQISGALFDLGISSDSLEISGRGFSFQRDEPLRMTYAKDDGAVTAETIVNEWREETLADIFYGFGEERASRKIAHAIVLARETQRITTTFQLIAVIQSVISSRPGGRHPATKVFQALRMAVNDELGAIKEALPTAIDRLVSGGYCAVITFHSIEDRLVKQLFRGEKENGRVEIVTKKPTVPRREEQQENPRSRSAKLRIVRKI